MGICLLEPAYDFLNLIGVDRYQQQPVFTAGEAPFTPHFGYAVMNGFEDDITDLIRQIGYDIKTRKLIALVHQVYDLGINILVDDRIQGLIPSK